MIELTTAVREVLSLMVFETGPLAHAYRIGGHDIPKRIEDEQTFILHRFLNIALEHGDKWRSIVGDELRGLVDDQRRREGGATDGPAPADG